MFKAIYDSPWHTPAFFWLAAVLFLFWLARSLPWLAAFLVLFTFEIAADALATGGWSPLALLKSEWMTGVGIAFVILGDSRYFLLVERAVRSVPEPTEWSELGTRVVEPPPQPALPVAGWAIAIACSFIVPLSSTAARFAFPAITVDSRKTFLTYEVMFLVVALVMRFVVLPRRLGGAKAPSAAVRRWILGVASFEIVQYALWVLADVLLLSNVEVAYLLRLVPNALYYAAFLPFVWWTAPPEARRWR
jgi:hypothetical protein